MVDRVLVPVDGSEDSIEAVEHAAAVADRYDASVHALYVLGGETGQSVTAGDYDHEAAAEDARDVLDRVTEFCAERSVDVRCSTAVGFSTGRLTRHPGSVILDCAEDADADFLVIPREPDGDTPGVLEKAAGYVLSYASQPVLSV